MNQKQNLDVYQIITDRIIQQLERGTVPWKKPWTEAGHPQNLVTKRHYTGVNTWLLASAGYSQNYFLTFNQLQELGGSVRKGEKGHLVVFWKRMQSEETHEREGALVTRKSMLRYYYVFNVAQCDGLPEIVGTPAPVHAVSSLNACEAVVEAMPQRPKIKHGSQQACYDPHNDEVSMPKQGSFSSLEAYYCTLFHELVHSTGHGCRLRRKGITEPTAFGTPAYSMEELIAEIGACYLNSVAGIADREFENSVSYISGWLKALKSDKRLIVIASSQAQRATDFILNVQYGKREGEEDVLEQAETQ
jgi:antirestriction protein ArdC